MLIGKGQLLIWVIEFALKRLARTDMKKIADMILDQVEEAIEASETKIDDRLVLPVIKQLREQFNIDDSEGGPFGETRQQGAA